MAKGCGRPILAPPRPHLEDLFAENSIRPWLGRDQPVAVRAGSVVGRTFVVFHLLSDR